MGRSSSNAVMHALAAVCLVGGCRTASVEVGPQATDVAAPGDKTADRIREDPVAYLRERHAAAAKLDHYRLTFTRRERLGLIPSLRPAETLDAWYRREPLAIKMAWTDPDSKRAAVLYDASKAPGKLRVLDRKGLFGLPARPMEVDVTAAVAWGESKRPITDFGLAKALTSTLDKIAATGAADGGGVEYKGVRRLPQIERSAHHIEIRYPPGKGAQHVKQDLMIDIETGWPAGVYLWLASGDLDAMYLYSDVDAAAPLPPDVFTLEAAGAKQATK